MKEEKKEAIMMKTILKLLNEQCSWLNIRPNMYILLLLSSDFLLNVRNKWKKEKKKTINRLTLNSNGL